MTENQLHTQGNVSSVMDLPTDSAFQEHLRNLSSEYYKLRNLHKAALSKINALTSENRLLRNDSTHVRSEQALESEFAWTDAGNNIEKTSPQTRLLCDDIEVNGCSEQVLVQRDSQRGSSKEKRLQNVTRQVGIVEKSYVDGTAKCRQSLQRLGLAANTSSSSSVPVSSAEDGVLDEQISKLWETFQILDTEGLARLTAEDLNNYDKQGSPERRKRFQGLIEEFNSMRSCPSSDDSELTTDLGSLTFDALVELVFVTGLEGKLGAGSMKPVQQIRNMFTVRDETNQVATQTVVKELLCNLKKHRSPTMQRLELVSGMVIVLNAITIGVSVDRSPEWTGWIVIDAVFTALFLVELTIRLRILSCKTFIMGEEWHWNLFDTAAVLVGAVSLLASTFGEYVNGYDTSNFTLLRLLRMMRITRLAGLLRHRAYKELALIVNGILAGMRTLFWASILLTCIIYFLAVLLTQTVGRDKFTCQGSNQDRCREESISFESMRDILFSNVARSMFTIFRCFTDDCTTSDGSPLIVHLWSIYGWPIIILYSFCVVFVCFGLFNLIMANFVESTMENAKFDEQRRHALRRMEHIHVAKTLLDLMGQLCSSNPEKAVDDITIDRETFDLMLDLPDIENLLDDLDISRSNRKDLFDILDANENGDLDLQEIISGLMRVRGPANKSDAVASLLGVRAMHTQLRAFERAVMFNLKGISAAVDSLEQVTSSIQAREVVAVKSTRAVNLYVDPPQEDATSTEELMAEENVGEKPEEPEAIETTTQVAVRFNVPLPYPVSIPIPTPPP